MRETPNLTSTFLRLAHDSPYQFDNHRGGAELRAVSGISVFKGLVTEIPDNLGGCQCPVAYPPVRRHGPHLDWSKMAMLALGILCSCAGASAC